MTAVPIHTVVTTPGSSTPPSHAAPAAPHPPGSPQAGAGDPNHQQQPQQDSLEDIRADLNHSPGGLSEPDPADQQALVDAVPHDEDGTPERFPDPFGSWSQLQNDGGSQVPGRSNNCADCSRSFLETWYGNPQVSAARTPDYDENGNHDPFTPEDNANDNQIRWAGAAHTYAGPGGDPETANNIASVLQQAGHGSAAIVQVDWPNGGGGHAFNVVNHNGSIIWIDTQSGEVSNEPLHIDNAEHVWHIPLDADRNPIDTTQTGTEESEGAQGSEKPEQATETSQEASDTSPAESYNSPESSDGQNSTATAPSGETPDNVRSEDFGPTKAENFADNTSGTAADGHGQPAEGTPDSSGESTVENGNNRETPPARGDVSAPDNTVRPEEADTPGPETTDPDPRQNPVSATDSSNADTPTTTNNAASPDSHAASSVPAGDSSAPGRTPAADQRTPSSSAEHPAGGNPDRSDQGNTPAAGRHTTATETSRTPAGSPDRRSPENPAGMKDTKGKNPTDGPGNEKDAQKQPYSDPHDRGTSDTSEQSRSVTQDGPESSASRTHEQPEDELSREYGIEPDQLQQNLRAQRDVYRVELDRVHHQLERWTASGELARVLQVTSGNVPHPDGPPGTRRFTSSQLGDSLDGFNDLSPGEQQAVVASLARLSLSFHQQHGVGRSPEPVTHPYRQPGEPDPEPGTKDRGAKLSKQSLGVRLHRMAINKLFKAAEFKKLPEDDAKALRRHGPDFTDKNFAVLEIQGPPPDNEVSYIVDSSVPANTPGVSPRHSEQHLMDWLQRIDPDGTRYTPLGLYTEREPCGEGRGHAKCSVVLLDKRLEDVPIHYSTTYRQDPEGVKIRDAMLPEKAKAVAAVDGLSDQQVKEALEQRTRQRLVPHSSALPKHLKEIEGLTAEAARQRLRNEIANEHDANRKATKTDEERAMIAEMTRHVEALQGIWDTLRPHLVN